MTVRVEVGVLAMWARAVAGPKMVGRRTLTA